MFGALSAWRMASTAVMAILAIFACSLLNFAAANDVRDGYNEQFVPMVDPAGRDPERDLTFSQANKNNSDANLNNAKAVKELAIATSIIRQSEYDDPLYVPKEIDEMKGDAFNKGMVFVVLCIFLFVAGFVIMGMFGGRRSDGPNEDRSLSRR